MDSLTHTHTPASETLCATGARRALFHQLRLMYQLQPFLHKVDLITIAHAQIASRIGYCSSLYEGLMHRLVQNAAALVMAGANRLDYITTTLWKLHRLPINFPAQFRVLVLALKAINSLEPTYLKDHFLQ